MGLPYDAVGRADHFRPAGREPVYEINSVGGYLSLQSSAPSSDAAAFAGRGPSDACSRDIR